MSEYTTATAAAAAIRAGEITSEALVNQYLDTIVQRDSSIHAFEYLDGESVLAEARARDREPPRGPLHGVPIAVKDIIATHDMPTAYGSPIYADHRPAWDAACVALCRAAGMVILGKTVTTEFAYFTPGSTCNPHNTTHTPGGSSSGSAAAVAAGMAPVAFGSQTAGSIIRPAAYCGIVGYKPSHGSFSLEGVLGLCPSLDTLGLFANTVNDLPPLRQVLLAGEEPSPSPPSGYQLGLLLPARDRAEPAALEAVEATASRLAQAGATIRPVNLDTFDTLVEAQMDIMAWETARSRASEYLHRRPELSARFRELVATGLALTHRNYRLARAAVAAAREEIRGAFSTVDALLTLAAPGEAPRGLESTGDPLYNRPWTALGNPCLTLPVATGPGGLPLGMQLVGGLGQDQGLLTLGAWMEQRLSST